MGLFLVRRLGNYLALCLVATFLAYLLASLTFDPMARLAERQPPPPPSAIEAQRVNLNLHKPIPERFIDWAAGIPAGDFGRTITGEAIGEEMWRRAGTSLRLFLIGTVVGVAAGVLLGVLAAVRKHKPSDYLSTALSFVVLATPVFVLGTLLKVAWLPVNQATGTQILYFSGETSTGFTGSGAAELLDRLQHLVLPTIAIALPLVAFYSRYQRSAMLDVLGSDFLRTARAKGLTARRALFTHGLRTALIPIATLFAFSFGLLVTGGVFVERIFGWYGMGDWLILGVQTQDVNIVATVTLFVAVLVLASGALADTLYAALDPRVRVR